MEVSWVNVASGIKNEGPALDKETGGGKGVADGNTFNDNKIANCLPQNGMEFETKEAAYSFYREYAQLVGFGITIKASRRSKKSGKFIDIKIACSRFGSTHQTSASTSSRSCSKTDCKASMHVKRHPKGKWFIYSFVEEHNHEFYPDDFYNAVRGRKNQDTSGVRRKEGLQLVLDERDVQLLLDYFTHAQAESPGFYYIFDFNKEACMRNVFWVDPKGRHDFASFSDVVFFDTQYIKSKYRIPFVPIVGVNHHFQYIMLGCALIGEESRSTFVWLMRTWLRAVGGCSPKVVITDSSKSLMESTNQVFPDAFHCFCPWNVFTEVGSNLSHSQTEVEDFLMKIKNCTHRFSTDDELENRWQKMIDEFSLMDDKWMQWLYENRPKWIPTYMRDVFLGGFCTAERSQSVASLFDEYLQKETTFVEFIDRYKLFLDNRSKEEVKADIETHHSQPILISHSPFEKQMSKVYTRTIYLKFQAEVSGMVDFTVEKENEDDKTTRFLVDDLRTKQRFTVSWNKGKYDFCCVCRLFEYNGYLCRHALAVLQHLGVSTIPSNYILKRWTQKAKIRDVTHGASANTMNRLQRLNELCRFTVKLGENASLSHEAYQAASHTLDEALKQCVGMTCSAKSVLEDNETIAQGLSLKEVSSIVKASIAKKVSKKQKVQTEAETLSMRIQKSSQEVMNPRSVNLPEPYFSQQHLQGMGHLNSFSYLRDSYYSDQIIAQNVLGNTNAFLTHGCHQSQQGLGEFSFRATLFGGCFQLRDSTHDPVTSKRLHD